MKEVEVDMSSRMFCTGCPRLAFTSATSPENAAGCAGPVEIVTGDVQEPEPLVRYIEPTSDPKFDIDERYCGRDYDKAQPQPTTESRAGRRVIVAPLSDSVWINLKAMAEDTYAEETLVSANTLMTDSQEHVADVIRGSGITEILDVPTFLDGAIMMTAQALASQRAAASNISTYLQDHPLAAPSVLPPRQFGALRDELADSRRRHAMTEVSIEAVRTELVEEWGNLVRADHLLLAASGAASKQNEWLYAIVGRRWHNNLTRAHAAFQNCHGNTADARGMLHSAIAGVRFYSSL